MVVVSAHCAVALAAAYGDIPGALRWNHRDPDAARTTSAPLPLQNDDNDDRKSYGWSDKWWQRNDVEWSGLGLQTFSDVTSQQTSPMSW